MSNENKQELANIERAKQLRGPVQVKFLREEVMSDSMVAMIADALPAQMRHAAKRYGQCLIREFQGNPQLAKCTGISLITCLLQAARYGLEIGGITGQAYMVPYDDKSKGIKEAQFQVGYRGMIQLAFRSNMVEVFAAHAIHQNDHYEYELGSEMKLIHKPALKDRGEPILYYAICKTKSGTTDFEVMSREDAEKHAMQYSRAYQYDVSKNKSISPWSTAFDEMAKKTCIRRLAKRVPLSIEFIHAATTDEYIDHGVTVELPEIPGITDISQTEELAGELGMSDDERGEI